MKYLKIVSIVLTLLAVLAISFKVTAKDDVDKYQADTNSLNKLANETLKNLAESVQNRLKRVIKAKGESIKK